MTIGIIGLGYVGLTLAIAAADCGITVYGTEIDKRIKACLAKDKAHFFEPGLDELIAKHNRKSFYCVDTFPAGVVYDAFVITVGTPLLTISPSFAVLRKASISLRRPSPSFSIMAKFIASSSCSG